MSQRFGTARAGVGLTAAGAALAVVAIGQAGAQEVAEDAAVELAPIVVSATSNEKELTDAPATVSVISGEELRTRPVQDVAEALRGTPGVVVNSIGLNRRGISIRGMEADHTLILVDGQRINAAGDAIAHADYDLSWMPVEAIERIEVVRGPMSSLYGSDALGGVVNVITRKATDEWKGSVSAKGGTASGDGGETYQVGAYAGGPIIEGRLGLSVFAEAHGRASTPDPDDANQTELEQKDARSGGVNLTWTPDDAQTIGLGYSYGVEERSYDTLRAGRTPYYYTSSDRVERQSYSLSHEGDWSWGETTLRAYRKSLYRENKRTQGDPSGPHRLTDDVVDGHVSLPFPDWNLLTLGGQWRHEQLEDPTVNASGEEDAQHFALFAQDEIFIGDDWTLLLGDRADHHEKFGWHQSPRAYLVFHATDELTLKGGVGRGFKAPTLKQLSPGYEAVGGGGRFVIRGNPELEPEINTMYELGGSYEGDGWALRATVFQNDLENLIETVCVVADCSERAYQNVDEARIRGVEIGGSVALPWDVDLDANYTYLDTENRTTGDELEERPRHSANVALSWRATEDFTARVSAEYIGEQVLDPGAATEEDLPGYTLVSVDVSHKLTDHLTLSAGVRNIGDVRLSDKSDNFTYAEEGRLFWAGMNYGF